MSFLEDLYHVDEFAISYDPDMGLNSAPTHFLGDISTSPNSTLFPGLESPIEPYYTESVNATSHDFMDETLEPVGIMAPLPSDYWKGPKGSYMYEPHGNPPHISGFSDEDFSSPCVPIVTRFRIRCSFSFVSCHFSTKLNDAHTPHPPQENAVLDAPTEGPVTKKVKREIIDPTFAADEWAYFNPTSSSDHSSIPASSLFITPSLLEPMYEFPPEPPSTQASRKPNVRKRKLNEPEKPVKISQGWENVDDTCSVRVVKSAAIYRCDLCFEADQKFTTKTHGDMKRHLQCLSHQPKRFECGCGKSYTRTDALKRHQKNCKA
jgi:hypothetical protein